MIFGVNFNGQPIPDGWARKFRKELPIYECAICGFKTVDRDYHEQHCQKAVPGDDIHFIRYRPKGERGIARLQGVATSWDEAAHCAFKRTMDTGLCWRVRRKTAGGDAFGIYCY